MSSLTVSCLEEGIFQLKMDDPEHENRLDEAFIVQFCEVLQGIAATESLKVLILAGRPEIFSAGGSLDIIKKLAAREITLRELAGLSQAMVEFPLPVIAALEGHAVGAGLTLALCCDVVVAAKNSRYGANYTSMGFTPGVGTTGLLPALVGYHLACEMMFTAKLYKGEELKGRGLFNHVVSADRVMEVVLDIARRMAEKPRHVLEILKDTLSIPRRKLLQEAITQEDLMHKICFGHPEATTWIETAYLA